MCDFSRSAEELEAARVLSLDPLFHPPSRGFGPSEGYCRHHELCERPCEEARAGRRRDEGARSSASSRDGGAGDRKLGAEQSAAWIA